MTDEPDLVHEMQEAGARERRANALRMAEQRKLGRLEPAAKKKPTVVSERAIQQGIVAWLRMLGCLVSATQNERGAASDDPNAAARFGASRKRSGMTAGFPDISIYTPAAQHALVEVKAEKGRLSAVQIEVHAWLRSHGHIVIVARSIEQVADGLRAAGVVVGARSRPKSPAVAPLQRG